MSEECIFCKVIAGDLPSTKFYEDADFVVIKNIHPVVDGHFLVVSKKHYGNFMEMDSGLYGKALIVAKKVILERGTRDFNLVVNNGKVANQLIEHFHLHVLPRKENDGFEFGV
jgi:histidine triad (HIT) family protein